MIIFDSGVKNLILVILVILFSGLIVWRYVDNNPFVKVDRQNSFWGQLKEETKDSQDSFQDIKNSVEQEVEELKNTGDELEKLAKQEQLIDETKKYLEDKKNDKTIALLNTEEECLTAGGNWQLLGLSEKCLLATSDAGLECSDGSQCQGECIAVVPEEYDGLEIIDATGICSDSTPVIGCLALVEEGKVNGIICID